MPIIFIAVQCCQCSTMQVKQQKKSSNKWNCVVCNEKQSVRKVFAQGCIAKDVRNFVQSFNMSRKFVEENIVETLSSPLEEISDPSQNYSSYERKRRSDWSEYLDPDDVENDYKGEELEREGKFEPEIVTELPKDMFKKPKLKNYSVGLKKSEGNKSYSPIFPKRKTNKTIVPQGMLCSNIVTQREVLAERNEPREAHHQTTTTTTTQVASKWAEFLTQDEDELYQGGKDSPDHAQTWQQQGFQFDDQRVEEIIHSDFL